LKFPKLSDLGAQKKLSRGGSSKPNDLQGLREGVRGGQKRKLDHDPSDGLDYYERATKGNEISVDTHMSKEGMEDDTDKGINNSGNQVIRPEHNVEIIPELEEEQDNVILVNNVGLDSIPVITNDTAAPNGTVSAPPIEKKDASIQAIDDGTGVIVAESQKCKSPPLTLNGKTSQPNHGVYFHRYPRRMPELTRDPPSNDSNAPMTYSDVLEKYTNLGPAIPVPPVERAYPSFESLFRTCTSLIPAEPVRIALPLPVEAPQYTHPRSSIAQAVANSYIQSPNEQFKSVYMHVARDGGPVRYVSGPPKKRKFIWKHEERRAANTEPPARTLSSARVNPGNQPDQTRPPGPNIGIGESSTILENSANRRRYIGPTMSDPPELMMTLREYVAAAPVEPSTSANSRYRNMELQLNALALSPFRNMDAMRGHFANLERACLEEAAELSSDDLKDLDTEQSALEGFLDDDTNESGNDERAVVPPEFWRQGGKR
jgi:hypothetical protein